jgi:hypothetical protein
MDDHQDQRRDRDDEPLTGESDAARPAEPPLPSGQPPEAEPPPAIEPHGDGPPREAEQAPEAEPPPGIEPPGGTSPGESDGEATGAVAPPVHRWEVGDLGLPPTPHPPALPELGPNEWYSTRYRPGETTDRGYQLGLGLSVPDDAAGWVTVVGLVLGIVSLPLPWVSADGFLVGAPGAIIGDYFGSWGLAAMTNWLPGVLFLVALGLVLRSSRDVVRHGLVPLSVALFGLGNAWPYVAYAGLGWVHVGVWLMIAGCVIIVVGAALRLRVPSDTAS